MRKILLMVLSLVFANVFAQTNRFVYEYKSKKPDWNNYTQLYMALDVNPDETKFYDYKFIETDSLTKKTPGHNFRTNSQSGQVLKRKRNSNENISYLTNNRGDYFQLKTKDEMKWKLGKETKTVDGYKLQKAETDFGGRHWTAWFAHDVNINEGPYKFRGLPGLIFEISDDEQLFIYKLVKNKMLKETYNTTDFVETHYGAQPIAVSWKQYEKIKLDDYENPFENLIRVLKDGGTVTIDNQQITSPTQLDQRRLAQQKAIRNSQNPLEKNMWIKYPEK